MKKILVSWLGYFRHDSDAFWLKFPLLHLDLLHARLVLVLNVWAMKVMYKECQTCVLRYISWRKQTRLWRFGVLLRLWTEWYVKLWFTVSAVLMMVKKQNFLRDQSGMKKQLATLQQLVAVMDPVLYKHLGQPLSIYAAAVRLHWAIESREDGQFKLVLLLPVGNLVLRREE